MRKIQIVLICAACLFFITSAVTAQKVKNTLTNADVVDMVKAGLAESTIVISIQQSEPNFDTSPKALIELSKQGVSQKILDAMLQAQPTKPVPPTKTNIANAIAATKDIGSLRVVLKSVMPVNLKDEWGQGRNGVRCTFEFINETQSPIVIAANANAGRTGGGVAYTGGVSPWGTALGDVMRTTLLDEQGTEWKLFASGLTGIRIVSPGWNENFQPINPTDIALLLKRQDDFGTNMTTSKNWSGQYHFVWGSMTPVSPGQSISVLMTFVQDDVNKNSVLPPKVFQMATEIVVGTVSAGAKKSYSLHNLVFDRITVTDTASPNSLPYEKKLVLPALTDGNSSKDVPVTTPIKAFTNPRSLEALSAAIERGEEVVFKIKYYSIIYPRNSRLSEGLVTLSKRVVTFQPTTDVRGFEVPSDKILKLTYQSSLRVSIKVAIGTKGNKEDKKEFDILHPGVTIKRDLLLLNVIVRSEFECVSCDNSMSVLFALLQKVSGKK
jgi:hypothetical protein